MTHDGINEWTGRVHCGDCMDLMPKIPSESIDVVLTSPPYNLRNTTGKNRGSSAWKQSKIMEYGFDGHSDDMPHDQYVEWQRACLSEMWRLIKPTGAIFYNHKWRVQAGLWQDRADIVDGFPVRQIIIWDRMGGYNNNWGYFIPAYEVIYLIVKPEFKLNPKGNHYTNIWRISPERQNDHPAPFPEEIPRRVIKATDPQIVLDPFLGSGTTAKVADGMGRQWIGIEQSLTYCLQAAERIRPPMISAIEGQIEIQEHK